MKKIVVLIIIILGISNFSTNSFAQVSIDKSKYDTSQPVDIVADVLTVRTKDQVAIFRGNVVAKQGDVKISANQMDVYYNDGNKDANSKKNTITTSNSDQNSIEGAISKIRVGGNVIMTTTGKKVQSKIGTYDVEKGFLVLTGNVRLNNEGNLLKGEKLIYNVKEGTSRMLSSSDVTHNRKISKGRSKKKRVKGLFIPRSKSKKR